MDGYPALVNKFRKSETVPHRSQFEHSFIKLRNSSPCAVMKAYKPETPKLVRETGVARDVTTGRPVSSPARNDKNSIGDWPDAAPGIGTARGPSVSTKTAKLRRLTIN